MPESIVGPLVAQVDVEAAVIATYTAWLPFYLAEVERKHSLQPKVLPRPAIDANAIHGGVDFLTWKADVNPEVIVIAEPTGEPERSASVGYTQAYEIQVGCLWVGAYGSALSPIPEDEARMVASYYGAASMGLVQQDLGGLASEELVMSGSPRTTLPNPDRREICLCVSTFVAFVGPIINQNAGVSAPTPPEASLYGGDPEAPFTPLPEITKTNLEIKAEAI